MRQTAFIWTLESASNHHLLASFIRVLHQYSGKGSLLFLRNFTARTAVMLVRSLRMKRRKRLFHDVIYTSAPRADLVHDVTDSDCQAQRPCFPDFQTSCFNERLVLDINCESFLIFYYSTRSASSNFNRASDACLHEVTIKPM